MRQDLIRTSILAACFATACGAGYLLSSQFGAEALRREAQEQLQSLMAGEVRIGRARLVIRGGLFIEGDRIGVYPRPTIPHHPALFVAHASAELDVLALITGRFRLRSLLLDRASLQIGRRPSGLWSPPPIQALAERRQRAIPDDLERHLDLLEALETVARTLLESPLIAGRVEVRRGRVAFADAKVIDARGEPLRLELTGLEGRLVHHWLSREADLDLTGVLAGQAGAVAPLQASGRRRRGGDVQLSIVVHALPLEIVGGYVGLAGDERSSLRGTLSGELGYRTRVAGHGSLALHWTVEHLALARPTKSGGLVLDRPHLQLDATVELHPGRVHIAEVQLSSGSVRTRLTGAIDRPLQASSRARLDAVAEGLDLEDVRALVASLPGQDARTLEQLFARVDSGRIDRISGTGRTRLAQWRRLLLRELDQLPHSFVLRADLSGIGLSTGDRQQLSDLRGSVEWSGDRIAFRDTTATWGSAPLPRLNLAINGLSHLFRGPEETRRLSAEAQALPGIGPLSRILRGNSQDADDSVLPPPIRLRIEALDHPAFRWPVRNADVRIVFSETGLQARIAEATWAGAPVRGEAVWMAGAEVLTLDLEVSPPQTQAVAGTTQATGTSTDGASEPQRAAWASGRFEIGDLQTTTPLMRSAHGRFELRDTSLELSQTRADLDPSGKLVARATLQLSDPEELGIAIKFSLKAADVARLGEALGLPRQTATGKVHFTGELSGSLRPQTALLAQLKGYVDMDARDGEIRRELPVALALARASEGFNTLATREVLTYEFVKAGLRLDEGRLSTEDFRLEGPLRAYASGHLDIVGPQPEMSAVVGIFLFRGASRLVENLPLVKAFLPGSERGLVGAYFRVSGELQAPAVEALPGMSLAEDLPDVLTAPFKVLKAVLGGSGGADDDVEEEIDEGFD